jgi:thiamine biosynthesis lipoprotein ApbE
MPLALSICAGLCSCAKRPVDPWTALTKSTPDYFATVSTLIVYDDFSIDGASARAGMLWSEIEQILTEIDAAVSPRLPESDISRFNALSAGQSVTVSPSAAEIFRLARDAYDLTYGLFNPSVYNLTDLWGLTPRFSDYNYVPSEAYDRERQGDGFPPPDEAYLAAFLALTDCSRNSC